MTTLLEWLRKAPQPHRLEVGGKKLAVPSGRKKWATVAESIESLATAGDKLIAFNDQGEVLRSVVYDGDGGTESAEVTDEKPPAGQSELAQLAQIITTSNDRAVMRYESMHRDTMSTLTQLMQSFSEGMTSFQQAWTQQVVHTAQIQAELVMARQELSVALSERGEGDLVNGMVGPVVARMLGGAAAPAAAPANGKSNGKKGAH